MKRPIRYLKMLEHYVGGNCISQLDFETKQLFCDLVDIKERLCKHCFINSSNSVYKAMMEFIQDIRNINLRN